MGWTPVCGALLLGLFDIRGGLCEGKFELQKELSEIVWGLTAGIYVQDPIDASDRPIPLRPR